MRFREFIRAAARRKSVHDARSPSSKRLLAGRRSNRSAAAMVEFAIAMPVFVLIVLATIEVTSMLFLKQSAKIAAYESTRVALVPGSDFGNVEATANGILGNRGITASSVQVTPANFELEPYGTEITVSIAVQCSPNSVIAPMFFGGKTISSQVTMMKEF